MLFKQTQHAAIADGRITRTVRAWTRPQARVGGRYKVWTIGLIEVSAVQTVAFGALTADDATRSGFADLAALQAFLRKVSKAELGPETEVWRVDFHFVGPDRRLDPGADDDLSEADLDELRKKLDRMDGRSTSGPWTRATLAAIGASPGRGSKLLAVDLDRERMALKADVRKLKRLGLTRSLDVGYELSPRGRAVLEALDGEG